MTINGYNTGDMVMVQLAHVGPMQLVTALDRIWTIHVGSCFNACSESQKIDNSVVFWNYVFQN